MTEYGNLLNTVLNAKQQFHEAINGPSTQQELKDQNIQIVGALCLNAFNAAVEAKDKKLIFLLKDVNDWFGAIIASSDDTVKRVLLDRLFLNSIDQALIRASFLALKSASHSPKERKWTKQTADEKIKPVIQKYFKTPLKLTLTFISEKTGVPRSTIATTKSWEIVQSVKEEYRTKAGKPSKRPQQFSPKMEKFAERRPSGKVRI